MTTTTLGRSGRTAPRVGLGLAALGRPGYINIGHAGDFVAGRDVRAMEAQAHRMLDLAWEAGIRYFDAARSYGRAEVFLGGWLRARGIAPGDVAIGSKWGYTYTADWEVEADRHEVKDHSIASLDRQWPESRAILGDHLGLYQIHSAAIETGVLDDSRVLEALGRLRDEGLTIGLSATGPRQSETIRKAMTVEVGGRALFGAVQATWNLLERSAGPALGEAHDAGLGVIIKEAMANGRLSGVVGGPIRSEANRLGTTPDALALAAVMSRPWVDIVLSGAATEGHLRSNLGCLEVEWDEKAEEALRPLDEGPEGYWESRSRLPWN